MILTKELTLKANRGNLGLLRKHNKDIKKGDIINIPVDSLPYSSTQLIKVSCDICGVELETTYYNYTRDQVNKWYDDGHLITFFTSRTDEHREITKEWLKNNNFKYHNLLMNKPRGGNYIWVDNHIVKGVRYKGVWSDLKPKLKTVHIFEE